MGKVLSSPAPPGRWVTLREHTRVISRECRSFVVFFVFSMRRVACGQCGVMVEEVPWGMGKHSLTRVYMHFLGH